MSTTLTKNVKPIGYSSSYPYVYRCVVTENSYSIKENKTNITIAFSIKGPWSPSFEEWLTHYGIIVDNTVKKTGSSRPTINTSYVKLLTWTGDIYHESDGSKSINIGVYLYNGTSDYLPTQYKSSSPLNIGTVKLTTIPRASSLTLSSASVDIGSTINATIARKNDSFTHSVKFYIDDEYCSEEYKNVETSQSFKIPDTWYNAMPSETNRTAHCILTTYSGDTKIGDSVIKTFTVNVGEDVKPKISDVSLTPGNINGINVDSNGNYLLIKGMNSLNIQTSGCTPGAGSKIVSYTFSGPSLSYTAASKGISIPSVQNIGILTYSVIATDSRGRSSDPVTKTIECYDYYTPYFVSFDAYRANSDGESDINGYYLYCTYQYKYSGINNTNNVSIIINYNDKTETASGNDILIDLNKDTDTTYKVSLIITDNYGNSNTSSVITVFGQARILNITSTGTGVAIGKMAEVPEGYPGLFECRWPAKFDDGIESDNANIAHIISNNADLDIMNSKQTNSDYAAISQIDCEGLLIKQKTIFDLIYPIGSIYMSVNSIEPSVLFGGTWERIKDTFLLSAGDTYSLGETGGEAAHVLTVDEMPKHNHELNGVPVQKYDNGYEAARSNTFSQQATYTGYTSDVGGGAAHNNMPPYLVVYMWKRVKDNDYLYLTDDGFGNAQITAIGNSSIFDDGQGNVVIQNSGSTTIIDDGLGNITFYKEG